MENISIISKKISTRFYQDQFKRLFYNKKLSKQVKVSSLEMNNSRKEMEITTIEIPEEIQPPISGQLKIMTLSW